MSVAEQHCEVATLSFCGERLLLSTTSKRSRTRQLQNVTSFLLKGVVHFRHLVHVELSVWQIAWPGCAVVYSLHFLSHTCTFCLRLSLSLSLPLSLSPSLFPFSVCLSVCPSVCLSLSLYLSISLSLPLSLSLSLSLLTSLAQSKC